MAANLAEVNGHQALRRNRLAVLECGCLDHRRARSTGRAAARRPDMREALRRPSHPSGSLVPRHQARRPVSKTAGHPAPPKDRVKEPTPVMEGQPAPRFARDPRVAKTTIPGPTPAGVRRPSKRHVRKPSGTVAGGNPPLAVAIKVAPPVQIRAGSGGVGP